LPGLWLSFVAYSKPRRPDPRNAPDGWSIWALPCLTGTPDPAIGDLATALRLFSEATQAVPATSPDRPGCLVHRSLAFYRGY
jgi:hypothetical protein